jgi:hypothetical protein
LTIPSVISRFFPKPLRQEAVPEEQGRAQKSGAVARRAREGMMQALANERE